VALTKGEGEHGRKVKRSISAKGMGNSLTLVSLSLEGARGRA